MVKELEGKGINLQIGDIIEISNFNRSVQAIYSGTYKPFNKVTGIASPEAVAPDDLGFILNEKAFGELWKFKYRYKHYLVAPSLLEDVMFPGLTEENTEKIQYFSFGYNQLLIRLDNGANKAKVKNQIQEILNDYNKEGSEYSLVVEEPNHNYYSEKVINNIRTRSFISRLLALIILVCAFMIGIIGVVVLY